MRSLTLRSAVAILALAGMAFAVPPLPRKSPEFTIVEPSGKQILLSSLRGKVVVFTLMYSTCIHCQAEAQMVTKLMHQINSPEFQPVGVAFNDGVDGPAVTAFVQMSGIGYPVGVSNGDSVLSYLGFSVMDRYVVPQIAVIDKKGMIRAQSDPLGTPNLQNEAYLKNLIVTLLKEPSGTTSTSAAAAKKTTASVKK